MVIFHTDHWAALTHYILLALQRHRDEEKVFLFLGTDNEKCAILNRLQQEGIFSKIILMHGSGFPGEKLNDQSEIRSEILRKFDQLFLDNNLDINAGDVIYTATDIHGVFRYYLIQKKISFIHVMITNEDIYDKYKKIGAFKIGAITKEYMDLLNVNSVYDATSIYCSKLVAFPETVIEPVYSKRQLEIEKYDIKKELNRLSEEQIKKVLVCFGLKPDDIKNIKILLLSNSEGFLHTPITEGGRQGKNRLEHVRLYQELIDFYVHGSIEEIVIKAHPNNFLDWNTYFEGILILNKNMPVELLRLKKDIRLSEVVALHTTALEKLNDRIDRITLATVDFAKYYGILIQLYMAVRLDRDIVRQDTIEYSGFSENFFESFMRNAMQDNKCCCKKVDAEQMSGNSYGIYYKPQLREIRKIISNIKEMGEMDVKVFFGIPANLPDIDMDGKLLDNLLIMRISKEQRKQKLAVSLEDEYILVYAKDNELKKKISLFHADKELAVTGIAVTAHILGETEKKMLLSNCWYRNRVSTAENSRRRLISYLEINPLRRAFYLPVVNDFSSYLDLLSVTKRALVFVAVRDNAGKAYTFEMVKYVEQMGLKVKWNQLGWNSYLAILDEGKVILEKCGSLGKPLEYQCEYEGMEIVMHSRIYDQGNDAGIILDGIDYAVNKRGINIVVYDKDIKKVVDSVGFDTFSETCDCSRKKI